MCSFDKEQYDIVRVDREFRNWIKKESKVFDRFSYNRLLGDMGCRIVAHYLGKHIPKGYKIVISAYIEKLPIEYDMLIVKDRVNPIEFRGIKTNIYRPEDVFFVIEIKSRGIFPRGKGRTGINRALERIVGNLKKPMELNDEIRPVLLLIGEGLPKRDNALNFVKEVREFMNKHGINVYILSSTREGDVEKAVEPFKGEWKTFVEYIVGTLKHLG